MPVRARAPTAGRHGPRGARSAAAVGEGWASGAPGNMAARPSTAASRPPVLEKRLGREVAEGGSPSSPPLDHLFHPDARRGSSDEGCLTISFGLRESGIVSDQCSPRPPGRARGDPTAAELGDGSSLKRVFVSLRG